MRYYITAAATPTSSSVATVSTGTSLKTLLQVKPLVPCKVIEWGFSGDASAAATPGKVELGEFDVAATVTAYANADLHKLDVEAVDFGDPTSALISVGTSASGYNASAEGTVTAVRLYSAQLIAPTSQFVQQFPLGREPVVRLNKFLRVRVLFGASINAYPYVVLEF